MESGYSTVKTPETESETPARIQPNRMASSGNGLLLRRGAPSNGHPVVVAYKECQKNHAASIGGHAVDGCGEFIPSLTSYTDDPASFTCAACGCHRNFHRRNPEEPALVPANASQCPPPEFPSFQRNVNASAPPPSRGNISGGSPNVNSPDSPPPISSSYFTSGPHMLLALSHGLSSPPPDGSSPISAPAKTTSRTPPANPGTRKRFRSRFTLDQKDKMLEFSDRLGWKMQKKDDDLIREFCAEIGVEKGVLKVWMHNNKSSFCTTAVRRSSSIPANITGNSAPPPPPPPPDPANGKCIYSDFISPAPSNYPLEDDSTDDSEQEERKQELNHHHLRV